MAFKLLRTLPLTLLLQPSFAAAQQPETEDADDLELPAASPSTTSGPEPTSPPPAVLPSSAAPQPSRLETTETRPPASAAASPAPSAQGPNGGSKDPSPSRPEAESQGGPAATAAAEGRPGQGPKLSGYVQGEYQTSQLSEDQVQQGGELLNLNRFLVRRARVRFDHVWDFASVALEIDANTMRGVNFLVRRAEASVFYRGSNPEGLPPLVKLTVGATDLPFGYEVVESARERFFMERSIGSLALFPTEADLGVKLSGAAGFLRYGLALSNGEPLWGNGALPRDPNAAKDITARLGVDVATASGIGIAGGTSFAYGKGFHRGQDATKDSLVWADSDGNGLLVASELLGIPGSGASKSQNFERWALGVDFGLGFRTSLGQTRIYGEGMLAQNYDRGYRISDPVTFGANTRQLSVYGAVLQDVTRYGVVGVRVAYYDPNSDVLEERRGDVVPKGQSVRFISPLVGLVLPGRARLVLQYDFIRDYLARDSSGIPKDAKNDQFTARLQVEL